MTTALATRPPRTRAAAGPFLITALPARVPDPRAYRPTAVIRCRCGNLLGQLDGQLVHVGCADCPTGVTGPCPTPHTDCTVPEAAACAHQQPFCDDPVLFGECQHGYEDCCGCCDPWRACDDL